MIEVIFNRREQLILKLTFFELSFKLLFELSLIFRKKTFININLVSVFKTILINLNLVISLT